MKLQGHKQCSLVLFRGRTSRIQERVLVWTESRRQDGENVSRLTSRCVRFYMENIDFCFFSLRSSLQIFKILIARKAKRNSICLSCHYVFTTIALQSKFLFNINSLAFARVTTCSFLQSPNNMYKSIFSAVSGFHISRMPAYCFKVCHEKVFPIYYKNPYWPNI